MSNNTKCARPCGTCPFLTQNHGRENPAGFERLKTETGDKEFTDWYSPENLKRLWKNGISRGEPMICHSTDAKASEYGGIDATNAEPIVCLGAAIAVFLHIKQIEFLMNSPIGKKNWQALYRQKSDYPLTKNGRLYWALSIHFGAAVNDFGVPGRLKIPREIDGSMIREISLPWRDEIVNTQK